ncbi:hypothetical protein M9H77_21827 [Catharanthus roseus]|uniref:Uncharacterized protein n=1 Tax=Catharanthus roseus TaxID=4058 RepID=A0ACC0AQS1_CATRO|nr:hypothetical protein M9H77_21827 [Catharanthus roseus]
MSNDNIGNIDNDMVEESHVHRIEKDTYYVPSADGPGLILTTLIRYPEWWPRSTVLTPGSRAITTSCGRRTSTAGKSRSRRTIFGPLQTGRAAGASRPQPRQQAAGRGANDWAHTVVVRLSEAAIEEDSHGCFIATTVDADAHRLNASNSGCFWLNTGQWITFKAMVNTASYNITFKEYVYRSLRRNNPAFSSSVCGVAGTHKSSRHTLLLHLGFFNSAQNLPHALAQPQQPHLPSGPTVSGPGAAETNLVPSMNDPTESLGPVDSTLALTCTVPPTSSHQEIQPTRKSTRFKKRYEILVVGTTTLFSSIRTPPFMGTYSSSSTLGLILDFFAHPCLQANVICGHGPKFLISNIE